MCLCSWTGVCSDHHHHRCDDCDGGGDHLPAQPLQALHLVFHNEAEPGPQAWPCPTTGQCGWVGLWAGGCLRNRERKGALKRDCLFVLLVLSGSDGTVLPASMPVTFWSKLVSVCARACVFICSHWMSLPTHCDSTFLYFCSRTNIAYQYVPSKAVLS